MPLFDKMKNVLGPKFAGMVNSNASSSNTGNITTTTTGAILAGQGSAEGSVSSDIELPVSEPPASKQTNYEKRLAINALYAVEMQIYLKAAKIEFDSRYEANPKAEYQTDKLQEKYTMIKTLGAGSFGRVVLLQEKDSKSYLAMKVMPKREIERSGHVSHIIEEKRILHSINSSFLISLKAHYQDNSFVYLVLDFINGGEMFTHLRRARRFSESHARFYAAQVVLAFEYLHHMDIIYRDLKPENILLDNRGYIKIIDMGFAKRAKGIVWTLCGTPEYIAPEILLNRGYNKSVDWYAFGILLYEMTAGFTPYCDQEHIKIYEKIIEGKLRFYSGFSMELRDLIKSLLHKDLTYRVGNLKNGIKDIKDHIWFQDVDWLSYFKQKVPAPFVPSVGGSGDFSNFDAQKIEPLIVAETNRFGDAFKEF